MKILKPTRYHFNRLFVLSAAFCLLLSAHLPNRKGDFPTIPPEKGKVCQLLYNAFGEIIAVVHQKKEDSIYIYHIEKNAQNGQNEWTKMNKAAIAKGRPTAAVAEPDGSIMIVGNNENTAFAASTCDGKRPFEVESAVFTSAILLPDSGILIGGALHNFACLWLIKGNTIPNTGSFAHGEVRALAINGDSLGVLTSTSKSSAKSCFYKNALNKNGQIAPQDKVTELDDFQSQALLVNKEGQFVAVGTYNDLLKREQMAIWGPLSKKSPKNPKTWGERFKDETHTACFDQLGNIWLAGVTYADTNGLKTAAPKSFLQPPSSPPQYGSSREPSSIQTMLTDDYSGNLWIGGSKNGYQDISQYSHVLPKSESEPKPYKINKLVSVKPIGLTGSGYLLASESAFFNCTIENKSGKPIFFKATISPVAGCYVEGLKCPDSLRIGWVQAHTKKVFNIPFETIRDTILPFQNQFRCIVKTREGTIVFDTILVVKTRKNNNIPSDIKRIAWYSSEKPDQELPPVIYVHGNKGTFPCRIKAEGGPGLARHHFTLINTTFIPPPPLLSLPKGTIGQPLTNSLDTVLRLQKGSNFFRAAIQTQLDGACSDVLEIIYEPKPDTPRLPNLHLICIGVPYEDLNYTTKDAADVYKAFTQPKVTEGLYNRVFSWLYNTREKTTKIGLQKAINDLNLWISAGNISPNDVLIFYLSSHGDTLPDGRFCIRTSDSMKLIYSETVIAALQKVECKQYLFLDACHSGPDKSQKDTSNTAKPDSIKSDSSNIAKPDSSNIAKSVSDETSKHTKSTRIRFSIMACQKNALSYEFKEGNGENGIFTSVFLKALAIVGDNFKELWTYIEKEFKDNLSKEYKNQTPQLFPNTMKPEDIPQYPILMKKY